MAGRHLFRHALAGLALLFVLAGCTSNASMDDAPTDQFSLTAGPATAYGYPMRIVYGAFTSPGGGRLTVPAGHHLNGDWTGSGTPDPRPGQLAAIGQAVQARLPPGTALPDFHTPRCTYHAAYTLDRATGLPLDVRLVVGCTASPDDQVYSKTYTLTIHQA